MRLSIIFFITISALFFLTGCATTNSHDPNAPVLPPTTAAHTGSADAALFAAKTY